MLLNSVEFISTVELGDILSIRACSISSFTTSSLDVVPFTVSSTVFDFVACVKITAPYTSDKVFNNWAEFSAKMDPLSHRNTEKLL